MISNSKGNDYRVISYLSDMRLSKESYERLKSVFHPKIRKTLRNLNKKITTYFLLIMVVEKEIGTV